MNTLLSIENLNVHFHTRRGNVHALRDLSLSIKKGDTLAIVGESGCGKSVTAHSINQLIPTPPGKITSGKIILDGTNLLELSEKEMKEIRGRDISMIFQEPMTSLNPVIRIGQQITDVIQAHQKDISKTEAREKALNLLKLVHISAPERRFKNYPHQLSGGMRQRVMIALALASPNPQLLIADEPTTALDVTIQSQILDLLQELKDKINMSILLITHDMGVVAQTADFVVVMYAGRKMEEAPVQELFKTPSHPYTLGLLNCIPSQEKYKNKDRLDAIPDSIPDLITIKSDECPFANRCPYTQEVCKKAFPDKVNISENHSVYCHFPQKRINQ